MSYTQVDTNCRKVCSGLSIIFYAVFSIFKCINVFALARSSNEEAKLRGKLRMLKSEEGIFGNKESHVKIAQVCEDMWQ